MDFIPIYIPRIANNQKVYVNDCLDTNWISSRGEYIEKFESALAAYLEVDHVITTCNGSVSLMLILAALGIGSRDEVVTQSLTYAATVSSILNVGAKPVLIDSNTEYQMDISLVEAAITGRTKAVMVAQLYGDSPDMNALQLLCKQHKIYLIEDSAECFGCTINDKKIGSFGIASSFSFFANKIVTSGEGGCVATSDKSLARKLRLLKAQSHIGSFKHLGPGYNFRMTNIQAAIGLAQLEDIDTTHALKLRIAEYYRENLDPSIGRQLHTAKLKSTEWMPLFTLPNTLDYLKFHDMCKNANIDLRPCFTPMHLMEGFKFKKGSTLGVGTKIYKVAFNLPCYPDLSDNQLEYIVKNVNRIVNVIGD